MGDVLSEINELQDFSLKNSALYGLSLSECPDYSRRGRALSSLVDAGFSY